MVLQDHLMLVFTGLSRFASDIAAEQIRNTADKKRELTVMGGMVDRAVEIMNTGEDVMEFGKLLHEAWQLKKKLSMKISNSSIDSIYSAALKHGAVGGKLLGAGGGGFMLLFVPPERRRAVKQVLKKFLEVKFAFESDGSQIVYYNPQEF
jgi:D-glycero-alpha-D-manno-heptose-7-phosphate kinase